MKLVKLTLWAVIALCVMATAVFAQTTREFTADGIKVILKPSTKDVISTRLYVEGGTANYPKDKEGIEALAFYLAVQGGTKSLTKQQFSTELEKIGTTIGSSSTYDYGDLSMTNVKAFWDRSWELFADAIMNPAFTEQEFALAKEQFIASAKQDMSDPDTHLRNLAMANVFEGKNYSKLPEGSVTSLTGITLQDVRDYYSKTIGKQRIFLVIAGDVSEEDIRSKISATLSRLPEGTPSKVENRTYIKDPEANIIDRSIATNYIRGMLTAPPRSDKEAAAMQLAMDIMGDRFFTELRTKRSLSYAPSAFYSTGAIHNPYNVFYISTIDPKQSLQVIADIVNDAKKNGFTEQELKNKKGSFITYHYLNLETNSSQTSSLGTSEVAGDWRLSESFMNDVNNVTLEQLNNVFNKYTKSINWTYLGDKTKVKEEDFKQLKQDNLP